jgi:hypothetical protein
MLFTVHNTPFWELVGYAMHDISWPWEEVTVLGRLLLHMVNDEGT